MKRKTAVFSKTNGRMFLLFAVCAAVNFIALQRYANASDMNIGRSFFVAVCVIGSIALAVFFILINRAVKKNFSVRKLFLLIVLPMGLIMLLLIPIGCVPDENVHFYRAYEISEGYLISDVNEQGIAGRYLPSDTTALFDSSDGSVSYSELFSKISLHTADDLTFVQFPNAALYSFISYLPQAIGIAVARLLHLPTLLIAYFGRLANFAFFLWGLSFSLAKIPNKKYSLLLICMIPIMLQQAVSLSADTMTITLTMIFVSSLFELKHTEDKSLRFRDILLIGALSVGIACCKTVYFPLCFLVFLIPSERFGSMKKYIVLPIIIGLSALAGFCWVVHAASYITEFRSGVDVTSQIVWISVHPFRFLTVLLRTAIQGFPYYFFGLFGQALCLYDVVLSWKYLLVAFSVLAATVLSEEAVFKKNSDKIGTVLIILFVIGLIFSALYIQWTPVASNLIEGVQGRYFLPLLLPIAGLFGKWGKISVDHIFRYAAAIYVSLDVYAFSIILFAHL